MLETQFLEVDSVKTNYVDAGRGPVLTLIHGFPETLQGWRKNIPELSKDFRVVALDIVGSGKTDRALWDYTCTGLAAFVKQWLQKLGIQKTHIVGTDSGGPIALAFAAEYPEAVDKMVVLSTSPYAHSICAPEVNLMLCPVIGDIGFQLLGRWAMIFSVRRAFFKQENLEKEILDHYLDCLASSESKKFALTFLRTLNKNSASVMEKLKKKCPPSLILWAQHEKYFYRWVADRLRRDLPGSRLEVLPDCGHFMQEEMPELWNKKVMGFLR